jgi:hypothetical protein
MNTVTVFRRSGKKHKVASYCENRCAICEIPLRDPLQWLCGKCRSGQQLYRAITEYLQANP